MTTPRIAHAALHHPTNRSRRSGVLPRFLSARLFRFLFLVALFCAALEKEAAADFPVGRVLTVTIESVDPAKQQFTFRHIHSGEVLTARWTRSTRYMRGTFERFGPEVLKPGVRAEVLYSTPAFGEPFVARVFLLDSVPPRRSRK